MSQAGNKIIKIGGWDFDPTRNVLTCGEEVSNLEDRASKVLYELCERAGETVTKEDLLNSVWDGRSLSDQTVAVVISQIRKALGETAETAQIIQTIPKKGYRIEAASVERPDNHLSFRLFPPKLASIISSIAFIGAIVIWGFLSNETEPDPFEYIDTPSYVVTVNDVRVMPARPELFETQAALSEMMVYYLSHIDGVVLIRHWWNPSVADPTGGIFRRYSDDTPVFNLKSKIVSDGGVQLLMMEMRDVRNDEISWVKAVPLSEEGNRDALFSALSSLKTLLAGIEDDAFDELKLSELPRSTAYWRNLFYAHDKDMETLKQKIETASNIDANGPPIEYLEIRLDILDAIAEGRHKDANLLALQALKQNPNDADIWLLLARVLAAENSKQTAKIAADNALFLDPYSAAKQAFVQSEFSENLAE